MPAPITLAKSARVLPDLSAPKGIADMSKDELMAMIVSLAASRGAPAPAAFALSISKGGINETTGKPKAIGIVIQVGNKRQFISPSILREVLDHATECEAFLDANKSKLPW